MAEKLLKNLQNILSSQKWPPSGQMLRKTFIEFLSLTWEKFMIRGGEKIGVHKFIKVHQKGFWLKRVISHLVFVSSCALHMGDFPQQQQNYAEHCNIIINVIFPCK